jgi:O-acetyl-ADP-ribose deacetylase (regulator of RNase III)
MPTLIYKDILDVQDGIIVHQINPYVMGAGLAKQIRYRYSKHYEDFLHWKKTRKNVWLGHIVITTHYEPLYIVGMCAQEEYGFARKEYTNYDAFKECLKSVDYLAIKYSKKLYIPYGVGCGLAGGDWRYILYYIKEHTPYAIICKLGKPTKGEKARLKRDGKIYL